MVTDGRALGLPGVDLAEARYALVAFADEQVLKSPWAGREDWMKRPLQLALYQENSAGENFFVRLRNLLQRGDRPLAVQAYSLCLTLGFRGAYGVSGDSKALAKFRRAAQRALCRVVPPADVLSPHLKRIAQKPTQPGGWRLVVAAVVSLLLVAGIVLGGFAWATRRVVERLAIEIAQQLHSAEERR
jgi:type IV/VI secretion system ImpK/VasF family protein